MLWKFNEEFGTGEENAVATGHLVEGNKQCLKELPNVVMIAMYLDPHIKSVIGILPADRNVIWQYVFNASMVCVWDDVCELTNTKICNILQDISLWLQQAP